MAKKTQKAPEDLQGMVEALLQMASSSPHYTLAERATEAKLYEIVVLAEVLGAYPGSVKAVSPPTIQTGAAPQFFLAGAPSKAKKAERTYFELYDKNGALEHEVWLSVEVTTLSWCMAGSSTPIPLSGSHELDVSVFNGSLSEDSYPSHDVLAAGFSCKHMDSAKAHVREVLGLRRETAYLSGSQTSLTPWLGVKNVPACPASVIFLVSSDPTIGKYKDPVASLGAYVAYIPFIS